MTYKLFFSEKVINDLRSISPDIAIILRKAIFDKLTARPYDFKPLSGKSYSGLYRLRVLNFRIVYRICENDFVVKILAIGHRRKIYNVLQKRLSNYC